MPVTQSGHHCKCNLQRCGSSCRISRSQCVTHSFIPSCKHEHSNFCCTHVAPFDRFVLQAKIGRAASFNSPNGLWPLPPQRLEEKPVRQSSSTALGSRNRGGEEGRVRGGLPRVASTLSATGSLISHSSATSLANTPNSSCRHSLETQLSEEITAAEEAPKASL